MSNIPYQKTFNVPEDVKEKYIDLWVNEQVCRFLNQGDQDYPRMTGTQDAKLEQVSQRRFRLTYLSGQNYTIPFNKDIGGGAKTFAEVANEPAGLIKPTTMNVEAGKPAKLGNK